MLLIDMCEVGELYNSGELAHLAEENDMLEGNPKTRLSNFKKRIYRYMREHSSEIDKSFVDIKSTPKGEFFWFVGQGGQLGLVSKLSK